jgi:hypothetical protein
MPALLAHGPLAIGNHADGNEAFSCSPCACEMDVVPLTQLVANHACVLDGNGAAHPVAINGLGHRD